MTGVAFIVTLVVMLYFFLKYGAKETPTKVPQEPIFEKETETAIPLILNKIGVDEFGSVVTVDEEDDKDSLMTDEDMSEEEVN